MKLDEKLKARKALAKIESGTFDENDLEILMIRLRPYSQDCRIFREAADFVAHNDERNKGLVNESLDAFALSFKYFQEFQGTGKNLLPIFDDFPSYVKNLLIYQVDKFSDDKIKEELSMTKHQLRELVRDVVRKGGKPGTCTVRPSTKKRKIDALGLLLGRIIVKPVFSRGEFMSDLRKVIHLNGIELDSDKFNVQEPKIILLFSLLMHRVVFTLSEGGSAVCHMRADDNILKIIGTCEVANRPPKVSYCVFDTEIVASEVVSVELVEQGETPGASAPALKLDRPLMYSDGLLRPAV